MIAPAKILYDYEFTVIDLEGKDRYPKIIFEAESISQAYSNKKVLYGKYQTLTVKKLGLAQ